MITGFIYHSTIIVLMGITFLFALCQTWLVFGGDLDSRIFILLFVLTFFILDLLKQDN